MEQLEKNLRSVRSRIAAAAARSGRSADDVRLIGVTKYVDADVTRALVVAGCVDLGESRPQVLFEKAEALNDLSVRWHLIGHLQRNKVKRTVAVSELIHSVDSQRLLSAINNAGVDQARVVDVLLEINVSGEPAKNGFKPAELAEAIDFAAGLNNVAVQGLMCMAGLSGTQDDNRREFCLLRNLKEQHAGRTSGNVELRELSMGMSGDFEIAIEEGATMVRVGSLLFES